MIWQRQRLVTTKRKWVLRTRRVWMVAMTEEKSTVAKTFQSQEEVRLILLRA
jgi:capsule polysaccharide export protein KpsC/LpsZ